MKTIVRNFAVLAVVLAAITAHAQVANRANATVPFAFNAAGIVLPAGDYMVSFDETDRLVTLAGQGTTTVLLSTSTDELKDPRTFLRFEHVGDQYILQQVAISGTAPRISDKAAKKQLAQKSGNENSAQVSAVQASSGAGVN